MTELAIGCGGWAYFRVLGLRPLDAYARAFNFVEINSTFYEIPSLQTVISWRKRAPPDFEFAVRCHQDVTHKHRLEPAEESFHIMDMIIKICQALQSRFLVFQTPSEMRFSPEKTKSIGDFFATVDMKGVKPAWEIRRVAGEPIPPEVISMMSDNNILHSVDLSRETPLVESDTVYTRIFGKGEHNVYQFTDDELQGIAEKIVGSRSESAAVSFHNVRMYKDAARFKIYKETGRFSSVTGAEGQESLRKVLREDAEFPTTKMKLLKDQGWKVIDLTKNRRAHARTLLRKLPDRQFGSIKEIMESLPKV
jgi:uncharacterized protein YecE (DUF72 family)